MRVVVRGFLCEAFVEFNGDINRNPIIKKRKEELDRKKKQLDTMLESFRDGRASEDEISDFNKLSDEVDELKNSQNNTLIVSLIHPGEDGNVRVLKGLSVGNGQRNGIRVSEKTKFLKSGLFKKIVIGEFGIKVSITDNDKENPFGLFLRRVLSGVFNGAVKSPIDDIGNVLISNSAKILSSNIEDAMKRRTGDRSTIVGDSQVAQFSVNKKGDLELTNDDVDELKDIKYEENQLTLILRIPGLVRKAGSRKEPIYAIPGTPNGKVVIRLQSSSL